MIDRVKLKSKTTGRLKTFEIGHANAVLKLKYTDFEIADDKYLYTENGIIKATNKRTVSESTKEKGDSKTDKTTKRS